MISRVADCCFWLGRYLERAESTARLLATTRTLALDGELPARDVWTAAVEALGERDPLVALWGEDGLGDGARVQRCFTWDHETATSLVRSVGAARDNARSVRDVLSADVWEATNELHLWLGSSDAEHEWRASRDGFYRKTRDQVQLSLGLMRSTMLHDEPLDFIWLGLLLERVGQTARIFEVHHEAGVRAGVSHPGTLSALWIAMLYAVSGFESYLWAHHGVVSPTEIARFVVLDERFPRSVRYGITAALDRLRHIRPRERAELPGRDADALLAALATDIDALAHGREGPLSLDRLREVLVDVVARTSSTCDAIGRELMGYEERG